MHIPKRTVNAFLRQIDKPKTHSAYRSSINAFADYCNGRIDTDLTPDFLKYRRDIGRSEKTVLCDNSVINCLEKFASRNIKTKTNTKQTGRPVRKTVVKTAPALPAKIVEAFERCDEKALAFAVSKLNEAYNNTADAVRNNAANVKWDAASWDEASERCRRAYNGLRKLRDVLDLVDEMYKAKAGVQE